MSERTTAPGLRRGAVGFLIVMELASGFLQGWFTPLLEVIGTRWHVDTAQLNWVTAIYMLMTVVFVPIIGKLGDTYGHRKMLAITAAAVTLGSIVVALAPSYEMFLLGRALQAPLAAFLPLEFAIVRERQPEQAGRSIGKLIAALTFGAAMGGVLSGVLYGAVADLAITLWVPVFFMAVCVPLVIILVPETTVRKVGRVDWIGAALLGIGLLALLGAISNGGAWGWGNPMTLTGIVTGAVLLSLWLVTAKRSAHPLIDLSALSAGGIGLPLLIAVLFGAQFYGSNTASSFYYLADPAVYGFGLGFPTAIAGMVMLLPALVMVASSMMGDRITRRIGPARTLMLAGALVIVSFAGMIGFGANPVMFILSGVIGAVGNGFIVVVLPTVVVNRAAADSVGVSSALYNTSRTAAGAVAGAVFALVMSLFAQTAIIGDQPVSVSTQSSFHAVWGVSAALAVLIVVLATRLRRGEVVTPAAGEPAETVEEPVASS